MDRRCVCLSTLLLGLLPLASAQGQSVLTNGSLQSFTAGLPNGWTYLQEPGGPATIESSFASPFTNLFPASTRSVRLLDVVAGNFRPELNQAFALQTSPLGISFDFYLDDPTPNQELYRVLLGHDTGSSTSYPFNIVVDAPGGEFRLMGGSNAATPIAGQTWYQFQGVYTPSPGSLVGTLTPFGGSSVNLAIAAANQPINLLQIFDEPGAAVSSPIHFDNFYVGAPIAVPEPTTLALLGLAAAGAGLAWRKRRQDRLLAASKPSVEE